jgi:hypothetical protein
MSNVSFEALPLIVPFFGGALLLSCTAICCGYRRLRHQIGYLEDRVGLLETELRSRALALAPAQVSAPVPTQVPIVRPQVPTVFIPSYPPAALAPPPYRAGATNYNYVPPQASAPPASSFLDPR